jgi:hypothetical protein
MGYWIIEATEFEPSRFSLAETAGDATVCVETAVAEEGPVLAGLFLELGVDSGEEDFWFVGRGFLEDLAERVGDEGGAPEVEAVGGGRTEC